MRRRLWWILGLALALRFATAIGNPGFFALDDYDDVLRVAIPAQDPVEPQGRTYRSPFPSETAHALSRAALALGATDPINQVRFIYLALGLASLFTVISAWWMYRRLERPEWADHAAFWLATHFLIVLVSTRALQESMSMPFVTASLAMLVVYAAERRARWLLWSTTLLAMAALFRFQVGIIGVAVLVVPCALRQWRHLPLLGALCLALFFLAGLPDLAIRGEFHGSLRAYLTMFFESPGTYSSDPPWVFVAILAGAGLLPLLISRYRGFAWRDMGGRLWPLLLAVAIFVVAHSAVPHKEERFMVPIAGAFLALLAPLSAHLTANRAISWRTVSYVAINLAGLVLIAGGPGNGNNIGLARYASAHPEIRTLWTVARTGTNASGYGRGGRPAFEVTDESIEDLVGRIGCGDLVALPARLVEDQPIEGLREVGVFKSSLGDRIVVWLNPRGNWRRAPIHAFVPVGCPTG